MTAPSAPVRDEDPQHPNLDGIRFQATTDRGGVIAVPVSADRMPPVSYLPLDTAREAAVDLGGLIARIRNGDARSYFADFLDDVLSDLVDAVEVCRRGEPE